MSLQTTYIPRANQEFFSTIFPLAEVTPQCQMDVFANFDHSLQFHGLSMSLNHGCPMLQLDRLLFMQMDHTVYLYEKDSSLRSCYYQPDPELTIPDQVLTLHSTLRSSRNAVPLGRFINLAQMPAMPAMTTVYSSENIGFKTRLHSTCVAIMGAIINSPIEIENGKLSLESNATLHNSYDANLKVTASTSNPWERLALNVLGEHQFHD